MNVDEYKKWRQKTKQVTLPSGLTVTIRQIPTLTMLEILDLGETAASKPSAVAEKLIPACLVEPKLKLDEIHPRDLLVLLQEIVDFSGLTDMPFPAKASTSAPGIARKGHSP